IMPRAIDRILAAQKPDPLAIATLFAALSSGENSNPALAGKCLAVLAERVQTRELAGEQLAAIKAKLADPVGKILAGDKKSELYFHAVLLATSWQNERALSEAILTAADTAETAAKRSAAFDAIVSIKHPTTPQLAAAILAELDPASVTLRAAVLAALSRSSEPGVANVVQAAYPNLESELKPRAIELLTSRTIWAKELLAAIEKRQIPADALNANQVRKLLALQDKEIASLVAKNWGTLRTERDPAREEKLSEMRMVIRSVKGDPHTGQELFKKLCGQCHKIHGEGQEVGPDITLNGRSSFEQLLSNVFDPSLVIGASYQARTVITADGRVLSGLLVEDNTQRIVLKQQGGKLETIARDDIDEVKVSELSLMPEGIEKQLKPQEIVDLFAFLTLDKAPSDASARLIPGTLPIKPREEHDSRKYHEILNELMPGFATTKSGVGGVGLLSEYQGRAVVVRTHPVTEGQPCALTRTVTVPAGKRTRLALAVAHHAEPTGDWQLQVKVDGKELYKSVVGSKTTQQGWLETNIDLTPYAGKAIKLELLNQATGWNHEFGYWGRAEIISE
ncbi:MAG TPA: dehydrogenase, partial [Pirellulaceae bacterium]|nr:dehydrogenase [Pirellulaceae bacterium]